METPKNINISSSFFEGSIFCPKYEKPLKKAFYNGIALLLISACSVFALGSFIILEPFLKPLFWAVLCGSVLHPLKNKICFHFKTWLVWFEDTNLRVPIFLGIVSCPIKIFFDISDYVGDFMCLHRVKILGSLFITIIFGFVYSYTPQIIIDSLWKIINIIMTMFLLPTDIFQSKSMIVTVLLAYIISLTVLWDPKHEKQFLIGSYFMWYSLFAHLASYFYYLKLPVFVLFHVLFATGFVMSKRCVTTIELDEPKEGKSVSISEPKDSQNLKVGFQEPLTSNTYRPTSIKNKEPEGGTLQLIRSYAGNNTSDIYISWVSVACLVTIVLQSGWLPYCLALLLIVYSVKRLCQSFGVLEFVSRWFYLFKSWVFEWYSLRKIVLMPAPVSSLNSIFIKIQIWSLRLLKDCSDSVASVIVILALVLFVIFGSMFLVVQAYAEGIYMMKVGGSVINQTVVHNPELTQLLPEGWEHKMDSVLNNAYTYGRQQLSDAVRNMFSGLEEEKALLLENKALEVWDRVYQAWMMSAIEEKTTHGPKVTSSAVYQTWDSFLDAMHKTPELVSMSALAKLAQDNMTTLQTGLGSVWDLVRGNASLVFSFLFTALTEVFSHSFAVLNFCISMIVFLTALFYLLSSSRQLYKPVEVITAVSPVFGSRLAFAMENAVKEVLIASFKLGLFYGMWTWLIHNLFQMNIVYIPSVLAAMLAVVPALGTYWACLPAVFDLWLAQGKSIQAMLLAIFQFLPTLFVDATIYTEIKEGHPYLTGLSVAGGLFYMGMGGAIIGPLILCCLHVVVNLSSALMQDAAATPTSLQRTDH